MWARVAAEVLGTLLLGAVSLRAFLPLVWEHRSAPIRRLRPQFAEIRRFLLSTNLIGIVRTASTKLDTLLVGALGSPTTVSLYRIAVQFGSGPLLISDSLYTAVFPEFSRAIARSDWRSVRTIASRATAVMVAVVVPVAIVLSIEGGAVMTLVAGPSFEDAGLPFAICLLGIAPWTTLQPVDVPSACRGFQTRRVQCSNRCADVTTGWPALGWRSRERVATCGVGAGCPCVQRDQSAEAAWEFWPPLGTCQSPPYARASGHSHRQ